MVQVTDVKLPTGSPTAGPTLDEIARTLAEHAMSDPGLEDLLTGLYSKLSSPGRSTVHVKLVNGRVQAMKVCITDIAERIYFRDEESVERTDEDV